MHYSPVQLSNLKLAAIAAAPAWPGNQGDFSDLAEIRRLGFSGPLEVAEKIAWHNIINPHDPIPRLPSYSFRKIVTCQPASNDLTVDNILRIFKQIPIAELPLVAAKMPRHPELANAVKHIYKIQQTAINSSRERATQEIVGQIRRTGTIPTGAPVRRS